MEIIDKTILGKGKCVKWTNPVDLSLPSNPMAIASNMATLESGETYLVELDDNGHFVKSYSIDDIHGINNKFNSLMEALMLGWTIKVEDMENYNTELVDTVGQLELALGKTVNGHLFIGFADRGSFGWHRDEGDVVCCMIAGTKLMDTEHGTFTLTAGDWLYMPEGVEHRARNITDTTMISFGTGSIKPRAKDVDLWASSPSLIG